MHSVSSVEQPKPEVHGVLRALFLAASVLLVLFVCYGAVNPSIVKQANLRLRNNLAGTIPRSENACIARLTKSFQRAKSSTLKTPTPLQSYLPISPEALFGYTDATGPHSVLLSDATHLKEYKSFNLADLLRSTQPRFAHDQSKTLVAFSDNTLISVDTATCRVDGLFLSRDGAFHDDVRHLAVKVDWALNGGCDPDVAYMCAKGGHICHSNKDGHQHNYCANIGWGDFDFNDACTVCGNSYYTGCNYEIRHDSRYITNINQFTNVLCEQVKHKGTTCPLDLGSSCQTTSFSDISLSIDSTANTMATVHTWVELASAAATPLPSVLKTPIKLFSAIFPFLTNEPSTQELIEDAFNQAMQHLEAAVLEMSRCIAVSIADVHRVNMESSLQTLNDRAVFAARITENTTTSARDRLEKWKENVDECLSLGNYYSALVTGQMTGETAETVLAYAVQILELCSLSYMASLREYSIIGQMNEISNGNAMFEFGNVLADFSTSVSALIDWLEPHYWSQEECIYFDFQRTDLKDRIQKLDENVELPIQRLGAAFHLKAAKDAGTCYFVQHRKFPGPYDQDIVNNQNRAQCIARCKAKADCQCFVHWPARNMCLMKSACSVDLLQSGAQYDAAFCPNP